MNIAIYRATSLVKVCGLVAPFGYCFGITFLLGLDGERAGLSLFMFFIFFASSLILTYTYYKENVELALLDHSMRVSYKFFFWSRSSEIAYEKLKTVKIRDSLWDDFVVLVETINNEKIEISGKIELVDGEVSDVADSTVVSKNKRRSINLAHFLQSKITEQ